MTYLLGVCELFVIITFRSGEVDFDKLDCKFWQRRGVAVARSDDVILRLLRFFFCFSFKV